MPLTRAEILAQREPSWTRLSRLLDRLDGRLTLGAAEISEVAALYRTLASDLMAVRRDRLGADIELHLDGLAARAHNAIYSGNVRRAFGRRALDLVLDFPGAVRRNYRLFLLATALFYIPGLAAGWAAFSSEAYAYAVLGETGAKSFEMMYASAPDGRDLSQNATMTGYYVFNNVGIAFRCFATGMLAGLGPVWFLISNGLSIGAAMGHLARVGLGHNIAIFVSTHSPWELTAIVISGGAGLQMGLALIRSYGHTRLESLRLHGYELLRQVVGAAAFLTLAAGLEGWVSPSGIPAPIKFALGGVGWVWVFGLISFWGRRRPLPEDVLELRRSRP